MDKGKKTPAWQQLTFDEHQKIEAEAHEVKASIRGGDYQVIRRAIEQLDKATRRFAEIMMDSAVSGALGGKTMGEAGKDLGEGPTAPHPFAPAQIDDSASESADAELPPSERAGQTPGSSTNDRARTLCADLAKDLKDPVLVRVLPAAQTAVLGEVRLEGELLPAPRGVFATTVLACTGLLFVIHAVRFVGRVALAYKKPAEVSLTDAGVRVKSRTEVLGRVLREREQVIVRAGLVRVVREVRFPRVAFYAGLLALAVGSWVGVRAFVDGVRAASPSLLLVGLVIVALGIAADFVLGSVVPGARGKVRVLFVPKTGATLCVGNVDARRADDALARSFR